MNFNNSLPEWKNMTWDDEPVELQTKTEKR